MINPVANDYLDCIKCLASSRPYLERTMQRLSNMTPEEREKEGSPIEPLRGSVHNDAIMSSIQTSLDLPAMLVDARVFDFSVDVWKAAYRRATSGELIGIPDLDHLPFETMWLGCSDVSIQPLMVELEGDTQPEDAKRSAFVVTRSGAVIFTMELDGKWVAYEKNPITEDGVDPSAVWMLWTFCLLISTAKDMKAEKCADLKARMSMDKIRKLGVFIKPPMLYALHLDSRRAGRAIGAAAKPHASPSYRYEVMGHERWLVKMADDRTAMDWWHKRGYTVMKVNALTEDISAGLKKRGIETNGRKWLALKICFVKEHERGPESGTVVATRVGQIGHTT